MLNQAGDGQLIQVLRGFLAGSPAAAWEEWLRRYGGRAQALAAAILRQCHLCRDLAEDVVQQASMQFLQRLEQLDPERPPLPYFLVTVRHAAWDLCRRELRHRSEARNVELAVSSPEEAICLRDLVSCLLSATPAQEREIMAAHYLEGRSAQEIAVQRGVAVRDVYRRLHNGRRLARDYVRRARRGGRER